MKAHHHEPHTQNSTSHLNWLRAAVLGSNDGIVSVSSLVMGVAGATTDTHTILVTGVAGLLAGSLSMAIGEYVSVSSQRDSELALLAKERRELDEEAEAELEELTQIYQNKGLKRETAKVVAHELTEHDAFAAHVEAELGIDPNNLINPWHAGIASALSFALGAIIPVLTMMIPYDDTRIPITFAATIVTLIIMGVISARMSDTPIVRATLRVTLGGVVAMLVTFGAGRLFGLKLS